MKIVSIINVLNSTIYSAKFKGEKENEFRRAFNFWNDPERLFKFFRTHEKDLKSGFFGDIDIIEATERTREYALKLEYRILTAAKRGKKDKTEDLSTIFKPLSEKHRTDYFEMDKVSGIENRSWLRIYAIRADRNKFIVTGGAIKLVKKMQEREHLKIEIEKLKQTQRYCFNNEDINSFLELY